MSQCDSGIFYFFMQNNYWANEADRVWRILLGIKEPKKEEKVDYFEAANVVMASMEDDFDGRFTLD